MSSDMPKQEFLIDDLPTTSVTIYPSRAHVVRDIADVKLQPGLNEVSIYGITPAADEHSVQVDGHGAATITDMSVELVPNRERFVDQFSDQDSSDSDEGDLTDGEFESMYLKGLAKELQNFQDELEGAREKQSSANDQMRVLNAFMESMNAKHNEPAEASKAISAYGSDRARLHEQWTLAKQEIKRLEKAIRKQEAKLQSKAKEELKVKKKKREEKAKKRVQREREKQRVRDEKAKFWPRKLYCVKLTLELPTDTPISSRRGSVESASQFDEKEALAGGTENTVRLSLSYVVREASWSPRYNVSISSPTKTATITYSAEFSNKTSETWNDAKVTLSTSQTSYSGLDDKVPELRPWPIFLRDKHAFDEDDHIWDTKFSPQENLAGGNLNTHWPGQDKFNRFDVFGPESSGLFGGRPRNPPAASVPAWAAKPAFGAPTQLGSGSSLFNISGGGFGGNNAASGTNLFQPGSAVTDDDDGPSQQPPTTGGLFGNSNNAQPARAGGLFGNNTNAQPAQAGGGLFGSNNNAQPAQVGGGLFGGGSNNNSTQPVTTSSAFGNTTGAPPTVGLFGRIGANNSAPQQTPFTLGAREQPQHPSFHQEPIWEDSGMTTAYELPGTRTLAPSSLARRHKITTITIRDITLSYIAIPKLRKGAFLRAQLRNPSSSPSSTDDENNDGGITLLQGAAGLTLDGSFLGNATLPRTAPGEDLDLDLGVDPAVHVAYAPAALRRGTTQPGLLSRDAADRYARCATITNARKAAVRVTVRDQVPLSEQERLRIEVLEPRGLVRGGGKVRAGEAAAEEKVEGGRKASGAWWGEVMAEMKEGNVVEWTVELEKGKSCKLPLEWEVRMPGDKRIAFS